MALTAEYVRSRLHYDPETGVMTWKARPVKTRIDKMWNTRFAGKPADHRNSTGHIQFGLDGKNYLAHRLAWLIVHGEWPGADIDHVNGIRHDNRLCNLRSATRSQNCANSKMRVNNTSGYRGVHRARGVWRVAIRANNKRVVIGDFHDVIDAANAYDEAALHLHGDFASLNFERAV